MQVDWQGLRRLFQRERSVRYTSQRRGPHRCRRGILLEITVSETQGITRTCDVRKQSRAEFRDHRVMATNEDQGKSG